MRRRPVRSRPRTAGGPRDPLTPTASARGTRRARLLRDLSRPSGLAEPGPSRLAARWPGDRRAPGESRVDRGLLAGLDHGPGWPGPVRADRDDGLAVAGLSQRAGVPRRRADRDGPRPARARLPGRSSSPKRAARLDLARRARTRRGRRSADVCSSIPPSLAASRTVLPERELRRSIGPVRQVREADGLEPSSGWPRSGSGSTRAAPPDPAGDALQAGPRAARGRPGARRADRRRARAAARHGGRSGSPWRAASAWSCPTRTATASSRRRPEYWAENAIHLPQMIATRWLGSASLARAGGHAAGRERRSSWRCPTSGRRSCSGSPRSAETNGWRSTTWRAHFGGSRPRWDRAGFLGEPAATAVGRRAVATSSPGGRREHSPRATPQDRVPASSRRCCWARRISSAWSARPRRRRRPAGRPAHRPGPLRPGARPAAPAAAGLRALPVRPAELRDHRLSPGAEPGADRPVQPVRAVVADRRGPGAEAHGRVGLSRARRGPDRASDPRPAGAAQPAPLARRAWPRRCGPGPAAASGSPTTPSATLIEFATREDLEQGSEALARGRTGPPVAGLGPAVAGRGRVERSRSSGSGWPARAITAAPRGLPRGRARRRVR